MEIKKMEVVYSTHKLDEFISYYDMDDDCEDFKVFVGENNQVFLLRNSKTPKCQFFPHQ